MAQHSGGSYSSGDGATETWVYDADTGRKTYTSGSRAGQSEQIAPPNKFMTVSEENSGSSNKTLIIIAIVGIIAAIVFARRSKSKTKQKDAK